MSSTVLIDDWRTIEEIALIVGTSKDALNQYILKHRLPIKFVGNVRVAQLRSFSGYTTKAGHVYQYESSR